MLAVTHDARHTTRKAPPVSATWTAPHTPDCLDAPPRTRHVLLVVLVAAAAGVLAVALLAAAMTSRPHTSPASTGGARTITVPVVPVVPVELAGRGTTIPGSLLHRTP